MEGIERIKILASEVKDTALLKIVDYLLSREDMNDKYLNEEKSLKQMVEFIKGQAQKKANNGMAMIEDEVVYGWAIHYFDESNDQLKIKKNKIEKIEPVEKVEQPKKIVSDATQKKKKTKWVAEGQLTLF